LNSIGVLGNAGHRQIFSGRQHRSQMARRFCFWPLADNVAVGASAPPSATPGPGCRDIRRRIVVMGGADARYGGGVGGHRTGHASRRVGT